MACSHQRITPKCPRMEYKPLQLGPLSLDPASFSTIISPEIYAFSIQTAYGFLNYCSSHYIRPYKGFIPCAKLSVSIVGKLIANDTNYFPPSSDTTCRSFHQEMGCISIPLESGGTGDLRR